MSATPNATAHRLLSLADARAKLAAEKAKRAASGRATPPADDRHHYATDDAKRERKNHTAREANRTRVTHPAPRIPPGPDRTCGNCGQPANRLTQGRCKPCYTYRRWHGEERHVTLRYGASKL